jgi:hypothetical protein
MVTPHVAYEKLGQLLTSGGFLIRDIVTHLGELIDNSEYYIISLTGRESSNEIIGDVFL